MLRRCGDQHVVSPQCAPRLRQAHSKVRAELEHVTRPADDGSHIATRQRPCIVVARHLTNLPRVDLLLQSIECLIELILGEVAGVIALPCDQDAHRVTHLRKYRDLALQLGIEELINGGHRVRAQNGLECGLIPPEGTKARLPRQRVVARLIEGYVS